MRKHLKNYFIPHEHNDYKPHSVRKQALIIIAVFAIVVMTMAFVGSNNVSREALLAQVQEAFLVKLTNENREKNNVSELNYSLVLEQAAQLKAQDMIKNQYFAHVSPNGKNPWYWLNQVNYKYQFAGENLAIDFYDTKEVAEAWMDSPTHRRNILNSKYTEIGIAVDTGRYQGRKVAFVVQMFATPRNYQAATIAKEIQVIEKDEIIVQKSEPETESENIKVLGEEIILEEITNTQETSMEKPQEDTINLETREEDDLFIETTFVEEVVEIYDNPGENVELVSENNYKKPEYSGLVNLFSRPVFLGKSILLLLIGLVSLSLLLKVFIEFRKQHYGNVIATLIILILLISFYIFLSRYISQVLII